MGKPNAHLESIGNGVSLYTSAQHPFGTDAILLADFAAPKQTDTAIDLGSGCGIIPFLWARGEMPRHITALELQKSGYELICRSIAHNALQERICAIEGDLRTVETYVNELHTFSLVSINPPYFESHAGYCNAEESQAIARHQLSCTTQDIMTCADKLLCYGGRLCLCHKPERLADLICAMREKGIEPKRLRFVCGKKGKAPYLVLLEGRKGGGRQLRVERELAILNEDGSYTKEMLNIYGDYGDGSKQ